MALRSDEYANLKGKPFPLYKGVLREAIENGLQSLEVTVLQYPAEENRWTAVCQATATFPGPDGRERIFTEIGDCSDTNCTPMIAPHKIRMAATRSKGRALRDALGIGDALAEEIGGDFDADTGNGSSTSQGRVSAPAPRSQQRPRVDPEAGPVGQAPREVVGSTEDP